MTPDKQSFLLELQQRLGEIARNSPAADIERNLKAVLAQAFQKMELVTRDEFDASVELLASMKARLAALEQAVVELERRCASPSVDVGLGAGASPGAAADS
jgi:BMFP domain-containing protein YqiC